MRKGYMVGAIVLLVLSMACIVEAVVIAIRAEQAMASPSMWNAVACHVVTAILAALAFAGAHGARQQTGKEEES